MANRRKLKKEITRVCGILAVDCFVAARNGHITPGQGTDWIVQVLNIQHEFLSRISHVEKGAERMFFRKLREDFDRETDAIVQKL